MRRLASQAHGEVLTLGPGSAASRTFRLDDAVVRKDWSAAWLECRRLAPQRLPEALTVWALLVSQGRHEEALELVGESTRTKVVITGPGIGDTCPEANAKEPYVVLARLPEDRRLLTSR